MPSPYPPWPADAPVDVAPDTVLPSMVHVPWRRNQTERRDLTGIDVHVAVGHVVVAGGNRSSVQDQDPAGRVPFTTTGVAVARDCVPSDRCRLGTEGLDAVLGDRVGRTFTLHGRVRDRAAGVHVVAGDAVLVVGRGEDAAQTDGRSLGRVAGCGAADEQDLACVLGGVQVEPVHNHRARREASRKLRDGKLVVRVRACRQVGLGRDGRRRETTSKRPFTVTVAGSGAVLFT